MTEKRLAQQVLESCLRTTRFEMISQGMLPGRIATTETMQGITSFIGGTLLGFAVTKGLMGFGARVSPVLNRALDRVRVTLNQRAVSKYGIPNTLSKQQELHTSQLTPGRSALAADPNDLLRGLHNGEFRILREAKSGHVIVDFGKPIGEYWNRQGRVGETQYGSVMFGKYGTHFVPANPRQWW